jgi:uncharacterized membrane protein
VAQQNLGLIRLLVAVGVAVTVRALDIKAVTTARTVGVALLAASLLPAAQDFRATTAALAPEVAAVLVGAAARVLPGLSGLLLLLGETVALGLLRLSTAHQRFTGLAVVAGPLAVRLARVERTLATARITTPSLQRRLQTVVAAAAVADSRQATWLAVRVVQA